jgi:hypothetical protein
MLINGFYDSPKRIKVYLFCVVDFSVLSVSLCLCVIKSPFFQSYFPIFCLIASTT